ncbi:low temperature requirement protein A [Micromonospora sp. WMMD1120]|uniref:low temperature requirement protein A n=1 Tax=Micromonospora sp. WMMD1120 TaxID=3016106 RepID=UPI002416F9B8|nr:low temperature requirement protein A [Micromonospora sp. WMMD1120]MDG4810040.1 low temperature requirement protein A [Micromonospora sp. WMMD1120]
MGQPRPTPDRVTLDEVFFDVVFVLTVTQLADVLETDLTWAGFGRTALLLGLLWYLYTGYAWLTNHLPPRSSATKTLLFAGMAGFLLTAIALPDALTDTGVLFAVGYLVVVAVHLILFLGSDARSGALRLAPYNIGAALLVLAASAFTGHVVTALWVAAVFTQFVLPYLLPHLSWTGAPAAFHLRPAHFVERHGLLVIVALGESVVAIGMGVPTEQLTAGAAAAIMLALALPVALWWTYLTDTRSSEAALAAVAPAARSRMAARAYVLPHFLLLLGVIATVSGLHAAVAHPDEPAAPGAALALSGGVALFLTGVTATRRALRLGITLSRPTAVLAVLATIAIGPALPAPVQLVTITGVLVLMLVTDALRPSRRVDHDGSRPEPA